MVTTRLLTADDLFELGPDAPYELIEGELIEVNPPGGIHGEVAARLTIYIGSFVLSRKLGKVFSNDTGFLLRQNPDTVLGPDVAFVRRERLPESPVAYIPIAPDLAIEVVSLSNTRTAIERKTRIYLEAGVEQVWIVDPLHLDFRICRADESTLILGYDDVILGGEVLPDFEMRFRDLFE